MTKGTQLASEIKYYLDYSKWIETEQRKETWEESIDRVMLMHREHPKFQEAFKNPRFNELFELSTRLYKEQVILGSNRALQFGGEPIMKHNSKMYNCLSSHCNRVDFFQECMYFLMSGCGVGYSVQTPHVDMLPTITERGKGTKTFVIPDSIEGWSDAFGVLISSYFTGPVPFPEYQGFVVHFDYSLIRPKGSLISGGFKAPGSKGLRLSIEKSEILLNKVLKEGESRLRPVHCYDIVCYMCDAVLSGGVRRSASICLFSLHDTEMMEAKNYSNFNLAAGINTQRARSNNSVILVRSETTLEQFNEIFQRIKDWGEPGFYFVDHIDQTTNPCVEVGMWPITVDGRYGWQGCNLVTCNGRLLTTKSKFLEACTAMSFLGTLQAAYTDFKYVSKETKEIFEREALLGVSITGWMNSPDVLLNEDNMRDGAKIVLDINEETAMMIGINPAARTTLTKPEGNTSVLLQTASGAHGEHDEDYFRLMQINKDSEMGKFLKETVPFMIEESVWSAGKTDYVIYIPVESKKGSIYKKDLKGVKQLEIVKKIQQVWVESGTRYDAMIKPFLRHNVSNTVEIGEGQWDEVQNYLFENKQFFSGVSFLSSFGDKDFKQAPFTSVLKSEKLLEKYGDAVIFASGLITDGLQAFDEDLWDACLAVNDRKFKLIGTRKEVFLQEDWLRRAKQFAKKYFKSDLQKMCYCLKDVHLFHKWSKINRELKPIDFSKVEFTPEYTEVDTIGSASCVGGQCEMPQSFLDRK